MRHMKGSGLLALLLMISPIQAMAEETVEQVMADDPAFTPQRLVLVDIPTHTGPAESLFNGRDLADWDIWLGYEDPALTFLPDPAKPIGARPDGDPMFTVVVEDGEPAMRVDGKTWGAIVHRGDYGDYHLRMEFKWSGERYAPRLDLPENNGLLYHSHGEQGSVFGTWMPSVEFEIMYGSTGMVVPVGTAVTVDTEVGRDPKLVELQRRFMVGGRPVTVKPPVWNVEAATDAEKPVGEWNVLDLYVLGDRAIHVVNGVPVMEVTGIVRLLPDGGSEPLTRGRIQFQSEGAVTYFRRITLAPIDKMPRILVQ
ncbi:3-keto-disaccharide hydrolase [Niveispirillum fermenti]|uniref:3-keto-disaccharide hydrolase n=1 Tax=Niveispirillum fermenti TaxID=1233113 RepID=UPI003A8AA8DB